MITQSQNYYFELKKGKSKKKPMNAAPIYIYKYIYIYRLNPILAAQNN